MSQKEKETRNSMGLLTGLIKKLTLATFVLVFMAFGNLGAASAAGGTTLTPFDQEIVLKAGEQGDFSFTLRNNDANAIQINLATGIRVGDEIKVTELASNGSNAWITFEDNSFSIDSGESRQVNYTVKVPSFQEEGTFSPVIIVEVNTSIAGISGSSVTQNLVFNLFISVNESGQKTGQVVIQKFESDKTFAFTSSVNFDIEILNNSRSDFSKPIGYFQIINARDEIIFQETINEDFTLLGANQVIAENRELKLDSKLSDIGNYKAQLLVVDQDTKRSQFQEIDFFVIPYIFILYFATAVLILVSTGVIISHKRSTKRNDKRK